MREDGFASSQALPALTLIAASVFLAGCESQELLKWFDNKAEVAGQSPAGVSDGVPGVQQGVPPELTKGYQSQAEQQAQAQAAVEEAQRADAERKQRRRPSGPRSSRSLSRNASVNPVHRANRHNRAPFSRNPNRRPVSRRRHRPSATPARRSRIAGRVRSRSHHLSSGRSSRSSPRQRGHGLAAKHSPGRRRIASVAR